MRIVINVAIVFLLMTPAFVHSQSHENKDEKTKQEIQRLFSDLNEAILKRDRGRLEQLYADEFQFIRPTGVVVNKMTQINGIMDNVPLDGARIPPPANENLLVFGDTVLARHTVRGTAVTSVFLKKNGVWQLLQAQGTRLAPERTAITIDPKLLDSFVGRYQFAPNAIGTVTREGDALRWKAGQRMQVTLVPLSPTHFFAKETEVEMMFAKDASGRITEVVMRLGQCQDTKATKID